MTRENDSNRHHAEIMAEQEQDEEQKAQDEEMAYWFAQYKAEKASAPPPDEDCGYELDDPKHPTWAERMAEAADFARDQAKDASYDRWLDQQESKHEQL